MKKKRPWIRWTLSALAAFILYQILAGPGGLLKVMELRDQQRGQQRRIDSLKSRQVELETEKRRLLTDSAYLEKLARKELGMAKAGEKVYRFVAPPPP